MKNKYWILILIGMIIVGIIIGIILYRSGFGEGYNKGYATSRGYCDIEWNEKVTDCIDTCKNFFGNIKEDCFETCIWHKTHTYGWDKIS